MNDLVIVGVGLTTPFGVGLVPSAAAVRAGLAAFAESDFTGHGATPLVMALLPEPLLPPPVAALGALRASARDLRLARLAALALAEAVTPLGKSGDLPVLLALPEQQEARLLDRALVVQAIALQSGRGDAGAGIDAGWSGRAGGLMALAQVAARLDGGARFVLVAGVDSYAAPAVLARLVRDGRIKTDRDLDGFIPGEGAAALLITRRAYAQERGLKILSAIAGSGSAQEPGFLASTEPNRGQGLTLAIAAATAELPAEQRLADVHAAFTGESYWAKEWGAAAIRHQARFAPDHGMHHPADGYGDLGAASGVALVALVTQAMSLGYGRSPALLFASSDGPDRAAVVLTSASA